MSVFINSLKTFKSSITGEEKEYKINLAILAFLESEYDLTTSDLSGENTKDVNVAKFVHAVFKANDIEVTLEEILSNTAGYDMFDFMTSYNLANNENFTLVTERLAAKSKAKAEAKEKKPKVEK